ncbi:hypothetical protein EPI10_031994 [Gossypium australe]|uniref:Uncharacterized protein n=1 Tax=Gossypium australe TaxID=47621 RepID=A0A5B6X3A4_9ROSI|nr:hypothetical protein EPI10_031994 [Gossypium australe]
MNDGTGHFFNFCLKVRDLYVSIPIFFSSFCNLSTIRESSWWQQWRHQRGSSAKRQYPPMRKEATPLSDNERTSMALALVATPILFKLIPNMMNLVYGYLNPTQNFGGESFHQWSTQQALGSDILARMKCAIEDRVDILLVAALPSSRAGIGALSRILATN